MNENPFHPIDPNWLLFELKRHKERMEERKKHFLKNLIKDNRKNTSVLIMTTPKPPRKTSLGFEIIYQDVSSGFGTRVLGVRQVKCPRCGKIFKQAGSGGCFVMNWSPMNCPGGCGFPWRVAIEV